MTPAETMRTVRTPTHAGAFLPEAAERIIAATRNGATRRASAAAGPIGKTTLYGWIKAGRLNPDSPEGLFVAELDAADSAAELQAILVWRSHFEKDWRACAEFLARHPVTRADWKREALEISGPDGGAIEVSSEERTERLVEQLEQHLASSAAAEKDERKRKSKV